MLECAKIRSPKSFLQDNGLYNLVSSNTHIKIEFKPTWLRWFPTKGDGIFNKILGLDVFSETVINLVGYFLRI